MKFLFDSGMTAQITQKMNVFQWELFYDGVNNPVTYGVSNQFQGAIDAVIEKESEAPQYRIVEEKNYVWVYTNSDTDKARVFKTFKDAKDAVDNDWDSLEWEGNEEFMSSVTVAAWPIIQKCEVE